MKLKAFVSAATVLGLMIGWQAAAQVSVIRQLPQSAVKQGIASWSEPYPEPAAVRAMGQAQFTGRISVGGRGGQNPAGETLYDVATDSRITLIQPLGLGGALALDAAALRTKSATDENQNYRGSLSLDFERLQFDVAGGYSQSLTPIVANEKEDSDAYVEASLSSGLLETLPMSLSYKSSWTERKDDATQTESSRSDQLTFKAAGTVGRIGVELGGSLDHNDDREAQSETLGTGGDLRITVPVGETLALQATAVPNFNRSESATSTLSSTSLESGMGILWTVVEDLETRLLASRVDSWAEGSGVTFESYQTTWKAEIGLDYQPAVGLFAGPTYGIAKTTGGNLSHDFELPVGWRGEKGIVREISANGAANLTRSEVGDRVKDAVDWGLTLSLVPVKNMSLNNNYLGGFIWEAGSESWNHRMETAFSHSPDPLLDYRAAFSLSNNQEEESEGLWKHQYQAGFTLKPQWNLKMYTVDLSEILAVTSGSSGDDLLSTAALTVSIPIVAAVGTRYGAQWEWINRTAPGEDPGNNFLYSAGLSVAGEALPFSFDAQYAFSHGYRGVRHDVSSGLQVPFQRGFAMEGVFTLSSYDEEGQSSLPFLLGLNLVYEF